MTDMERARWSDERLDEKMAAVDTTLERIDANLVALRTELHEEMRATRAEFQEDMRLMRADFSRMQDRLVQIGFGLVIALIGALAALIVALTS
jgi:hypothetical protein